MLFYGKIFMVVLESQNPLEQVLYNMYNMVSYYRAERQSAANGQTAVVNKLLSAYHSSDREDKELTPAVQELCTTIDAYIFVIDSSRALVEGEHQYCLLVAGFAKTDLLSHD